MINHFTYNWFYRITYFSALPLILVFLSLPCLSQQHDTIEPLISKAKNDSEKIVLLFDLSEQIRHNNPDRAVELCREGIITARESGMHLEIAAGYHQLGIIAYYRGAYNEALKNYILSLSVCEKLQTADDSVLVLKARTSIAQNYHNIGKVFYRQKNYGKALDYYRQALRIFERLRNKNGMSSCFNNISGIYYEKKNFEKCLSFLKKSLEIEKEGKNPDNIATRLHNIGIIYRNIGDRKKAMDHFMDALQIREQAGDLKGMAYSYNDIGLFFYQDKNYSKAIENINKGMEIALKSGVKERIKAAYESLAKIYGAMGKAKEAYEYYERFAQIKDSILNEETSRQIAEMQTKYESDKKENENEILRKEKALQKLEITKQKIIISFISAGIILLIFLGFYIYRNYLRKKKANIELNIRNNTILNQKGEIELQKKIIEEKNRSITDSIYYAQRIQEAILPSDKSIKVFFPGSFIFYKPKDIVCGDFYWVAKIENGKTSVGENEKSVILAVCDCTGHGVPGALLSMTGNDLLNEITEEGNAITPDQVLSELDRKLKSALNPSGKKSEVYDGMDIAMIRMDPNSTFTTGNSGFKLKYSGANRPLWIVRNGNLLEFRPDRVSIGGHFEGEKKFTLLEIPIEKNDMIYLFSDGYADQIGGPSGKKFMSGNFKELLRTISSKTLSEQEKILNSTFEEWRGSREQMDDVTVMGIRI
ncbi:MAG: tetratricopeptide repeat protein [Bacteroidetes bacterium]|nr:tetratricopeptide repeat protein [Bacteroidota bacterium]